MPTGDPQIYIRYDGDTVWRDWVGTGTGTTISTSNAIFGEWITTTATNTTVDEAWTGWSAPVQYYGRVIRTRSYDPQVYQSYSPQPPPTPEQLEAARRQREAADREYRRRLLREMWQRWITQARYRWYQKDREEAELKAETLLFECLTEEQRIDWLAEKAFHVHTASGRVYRINYGNVGNVYLIGNDGNMTHKYCIHLINDEPVHDTMLAQKLLLETDEERFLQVANLHF